MKLKKKVIEFMAIEMALKELKIVPDFGFQVFVSRNLKKLDHELSPIRDKSKNSEGYDSVMKKYEELRISLAKKDEKGKPVIVDDVDERGNAIKRYDPEDEKVFTEKLNEFWEEEENKKVQEEQQKLMSDYYKFISETEIEIELVTFSIKNIPVEFFNSESNKSIMMTAANLLEELFS